MSEKFQVDLDELDGVVRRLKHLQADMDEPNEKIKYSTVIPKSAFGVDFDEAHDLSSAHDEMHNYMTQVITALQDLIRDFSGKAERSHGAYDDREQETKASMSS
ncbi:MULTISPECIES: hypothetical protein [Streptomyces]|uniref:PE domain-containing protein n=1 Tax=Streptomyces ramulosus TaxID=47762 RepID=A0ABW1FJU4_9ACTN